MIGTPKRRNFFSHLEQHYFNGILMSVGVGSLDHGTLWQTEWLKKQNPADIGLSMGSIESPNLTGFVKLRCQAPWSDPPRMRFLPADPVVFNRLGTECVQNGTQADLTCGEQRVYTLIRIQAFLRF